MPKNIKNNKNYSKTHFLPSSIEIELFAQALLKGIEEIKEKVGENASRDLEKVKFYFKNVVNSLVEEWRENIPLETTASRPGIGCIRTDRAQEPARDGFAHGSA